MKRCLLSFLSLILCTVFLSMDAYQASAENSVFFSELKEDAPKVFQFKEVVNGINVDITAPVILPNVDRVPIYALCYAPLGTERELDRISKYLNSSSASSELLIQPMSSWLVSIRSDAVQRVTSHKKRGYSLRFPIIPEDQAVGSSVTPKIPFESIRELLSILFPELDFYLKGQHATGGGYFEKANSVGKRDEELLQGPPDEGFETGYYNLLIGQKLDGIPLFPDTYFAIENQGDPSEPTARISVDSFFNSDMFNMTLQLVLSKKRVTEDVRLVDYSAIESTITSQIRKGAFREIESITFGYMLFYATSYTPEQVEVEELKLIAIPTWEIIANSGWGAQTDGFPITDREKKARSVSLHSGVYVLRIDALTGEILDKYADPPPRTHTYSQP